MGREEGEKGWEHFDLPAPLLSGDTGTDDMTSELFDRKVPGDCFLLQHFRGCFGAPPPLNSPRVSSHRFLRVGDCRSVRGSPFPRPEHPSLPPSPPVEVFQPSRWPSRTGCEAALGWISPLGPQEP